MNEAYFRGFNRRCRERGVDAALLMKHAEAVAGRLEKKAGVGSVLKGILSGAARNAKRVVPFKGSMMKHPVRWGAGALAGGGATALGIGSDALFGKNRAVDPWSIAGGAAVGAGVTFTGMLVGDLVAQRIRERRRKKALADSADASAQETNQLPGIG